jgi:hypothetical protein
MDSLDCLISAVESVDEVGEMEVVPNPASDWVELRFTDPATELTTLQIFDLTGRLLQRYFLPAGTEVYSLDIAVLPAGIYWIILQKDGRVVGQQKVLVHK